VNKAAIPPYLEIIDFVASGTPRSGEKSEPHHFMDLEHILGVAMARARQILASGS